MLVSLVGGKVKAECNICSVQPKPATRVRWSTAIFHHFSKLHALKFVTNLDQMTTAIPDPQLSPALRRKKRKLSRGGNGRQSGEVEDIPSPTSEIPKTNGKKSRAGKEGAVATRATPPHAAAPCYPTWPPPPTTSVPRRTPKLSGDIQLRARERREEKAPAHGCRRSTLPVV